MVTESDTAFPKETRESLMSKTNLTGHDFQGLADSVGGLRSLEETFGDPRRLLRLTPQMV